MATVDPFIALRPTPGREQEVSCLPYDVFYDHEVREIIAANPNSFLRVTRPEGEFPEHDEPSREAVFAAAKANLERFISDGIFSRDLEPSYYVYRLTEGEHTQTGVIGCCAIDEYESGQIKRHEFTRPDKVADRTDHMITLRAQTGLIFLAFRGTDVTRDLFAKAVDSAPLYDLTCENSIRHQVWRLTNNDEWHKAFAAVPTLYVADGHHRLESARLAREILRKQDPASTGTEPYNFVVAGIFPAEDLAILPYNRAVADLNGLSKDEFLERLGEGFTVTKTAEKRPSQAGETGMFLDGEWYKLRSTTNYIREPDPIDRLDVSVLQNFVLAPILGISDPRTDKRVSFIGGRRGVEELERLVNSGEAAVAFSMFATTMDDLFAVSDRDEIMPPKSTWFEPKLRDGLVVHEI